MLKNRPIKYFFVFISIALVSLFAGRTEKSSWIFYDYFQTFQRVSSQKNVAVVTIDQPTLNELEKEGIDFPLPRQIYGAAVKVAEHLGAKAAMFDILFTENSVKGVADDELFADFIKQAKIPTFFPGMSTKGSVKDPIPLLKEAAAGTGAATYPAEVDGIYRRVDNEIVDEGVVRVSAPEVLYRHLTGKTSEVERVLLRPYAENAIPTVSMYNVLRYYRALEDGIVSPELSREFADLQGRVWVFGYSAPGLLDLKPMPLDKRAPGFLIPATAVANRFDQNGIGVFATQIQLLLALLLALIFVLIIDYIDDPYRAGVLWLGGFAAVPPVLSFVLIKFGWWLAPVGIMVAVFVAGFLQILWKFETVWKEQFKLAKSLEFSMSPDMVKLIRSGKVKISRFGEDREISIMFSDLAGYTNLSEKLPAPEMVKILNAYLDDVVQLITSHNGYVDKFIGDAVMVLWGAPIAQEGNAKAALSAALKFHEVSEAFNNRMQASNPGFEKLVTRVGLHYGKAVVGNIGAQNRHNYTAIGDAVNLASRLEGMGKNYHLTLLMSDDFVKAAEATGHDLIIEIDTIRVKGKTLPTKIFSAVTVQQRPLKEIYERGLKFYYSEQWSKALTEFKAASALDCADVMIARCEQALKNGKPDKFVNGAWIYDSK